MYSLTLHLDFQDDSAIIGFLKLFLKPVLTVSQCRYYGTGTQRLIFLELFPQYSTFFYGCGYDAQERSPSSAYGDLVEGSGYFTKLLR